MDPMLPLGLLLFLGVHSIGLFAPDWRERSVRRFGVGAWKGLYALLSLAGLLLIIYGYSAARMSAELLYAPPLWTRHLAALLTLPVFVLLIAAYLPRTHIRRLVGHPMLLAVKLWALAHLLANGMLADVLLFGSFLVWAVALYAVSRRRDRRSGRVHLVGSWARDGIAVLLGLALWAGFALHLHGWLFGVAPFG